MCVCVCDAQSFSTNPKRSPSYSTWLGEHARGITIATRHARMHRLALNPWFGKRSLLLPCVCAKTSIRIVLKLQGSTFLCACACVCDAQGVFHHFYQVSRLSLYGHTGVRGSGHSPLEHAFGM